MKRIAIFASGSGTNALNIIEFFKSQEKIQVAIVITNNPVAPLIEKVNLHKIPIVVLNNEFFKTEGYLLNILDFHKIDLIVLAGFLRRIDKGLIDKYKIVNIHPSLLPKYGGLGMWGMKVHEQVIKNRETETGITIHWVNSNYDEGEIIYQSKFNIELGDTAEIIANKVHQLEYKYYPLVIEYLLM